MPQRYIFYIGDSAWCPYGNREPHAIRDRVFKLTDTLLTQNCGLIVIACNSATICAVEALRAEYMIPFTGMEPAVKPAVRATRSGVIGVLATEASLSGEKFHKLVHTHGEGVKVITTPCPEFVNLVEAGQLKGPRVIETIKRYTDTMIQQGADTLVLGCTHYPFLKEAIQQHVGEQVALIDTGQAVAKQTQRLYDEHYRIDETQAKSAGKLSVFTTGQLSSLEKIFPLLCPDTVATLRVLEPEKTSSLKFQVTR